MSCWLHSLFSSHLLPQIHVDTPPGLPSRSTLTVDVLSLSTQGQFSTHFLPFWMSPVSFPFSLATYSTHIIPSPDKTLITFFITLTYVMLYVNPIESINMPTNVSISVIREHCEITCTLHIPRTVKLIE